ncbi:hypothetical protein GQ53DRAFT_745602 [Thozetella sp. PMI_491]|nr:hypothetical protein GQ53DRAFT_745602 [Thozetella sp. PMI_491]
MRVMVDQSAKNNDSKPDYRRVEPPATEDMVIEAELFLPPALNNHAEYVKKVLDDYSARIRGAVTILKETPAYSELKNAVRMRKKDPQSVKGDGIAKMREQLREPSDKLRRIIKYGLDLPDSTFLQRLGSENLVTTAVLNVLVNLNNQDEGNSSLAKTILKLLCRFTTLTPFLLEGKYKLEGAKVKLLRERGDDEVNQLLDDLLAMVEKNKDKDGSPRQIAKPADQKGAKTGSPSKKSDGTTGAVRSASATKRPREEDAEVRTSKKLATGATKSSSSPALSGPAATKPAPAAARSSSTSLAAKLAVKKSPATSSTATAKPAAGVLPGKRAPVKPAPRTDSPTSDPPKPAVKPEPAPKMDFSKLEITKPGSKPAAGSSSTSSSLTGNKPPVVKKAPAPPPSGKSKFASLLDEINDPKTETRRGPVLPADPAKEETEEEKKRRLRKEERRRQNLRVTFKSDDRLVEVREFERHEDEEPGDFMTWGIDNSESKTDEGRALRESHLSNIRSYEDLIPIDFPSSLATAARGEAYTTRGGPKQFRTAEQAFMEDRDSKVLSVVYTSKEDIPPTPKSPTLASSGPASTQQPEQWPLPTGAPLLDEMHRRHKDFQQQGLRKAAEHALHRQANPVFGDYQNVMEKVDAVIRQNQNMALPAERPTQPTPVTAHPPPQAPTTATAADPDRRPIDANNLSAYLQKMMAVDWNASGMEMARGNAVADMLTNIPWNSIPKSSLPYSVNDPYDPAKATTQRRHDYANPEVQKSADTLENFVAQFNRDRPLEMQNRVIAEIRSQAHAETEAKAQAQAQAKAMEEAARAAVLQAEQAQAQPSREDHAAAWVRYWQENPQAAGAFYQQQQEQQQLRQQQEQEQQQQLQQQQQQQQMQQQQQQQNAGVQAVLAQLQLGTHQAAPAVASSGMMRGGSAEGYGGHAGHGQQAASTGRGQNRSHGGRRNRGSGGAAGTDEGEDSEPSRAVNPSKVGTKQCSFWLKGKCAKGDRCTYRHA